MIIFLIFLIAFFLVLTIWYFNKTEEEEKLVIAKNIKEVVTLNEINIGLYSEQAIENINSIESNNETIRLLSNLIYNGLFEYDDSGALTSTLIEDYAKIDEKNYVFKLKENIKFHNGKILTSDDVKNTVENIFSQDNSYYTKCVENIQSIKVIDNLTLRINLIEKEDGFEKNLIFPILSDDLNVGTNDYKFNEMKDYISNAIENYQINEIVGDKVNGNETNQIKANEINTKIVKLENIKTGQALNIYIYNNLETLYGDFKNKKLDFIKSIENIEHKNYIGEFGYQEKNYKGNEYIKLEFNTDSYFRDSKLKEAVLAGINPQEIVSKIFYNNAYNVKDLEYDLDRAVQILEEQKYIYKDSAWYYKDKMLKFNVLLNKKLLTNLEIAYIIKGQLEKIGIKIELIIVDEGEYNKKINEKDYDILISNYKTDIYENKKVENAIICNKLSVLYSLNLSGKILPNRIDIFYRDRYLEENS